MGALVAYPTLLPTWWGGGGVVDFRLGTLLCEIFQMLTVPYIRECGVFCKGVLQRGMLRVKSRVKVSSALPFNLWWNRGKGWEFCLQFSSMGVAMATPTPPVLSKSFSLPLRLASPSVLLSGNIFLNYLLNSNVFHNMKHETLYIIQRVCADPMIWRSVC